MSFNQILEGLGLIYRGIKLILVGILSPLGIESALVDKLIILLAILFTLKFASENLKAILLLILILLILKLYFIW